MWQPHLLDLGPVLPFGPVEEDEARHQPGVEEDHHDDDGNDGALGAAHVARVTQVCGRDKVKARYIVQVVKSE